MTLSLTAAVGRQIGLNRSLGLDGGDGHGVDDIGHGAAAIEVIDRLLSPAGGSYGHRPRGTLHLGTGRGHRR